MIAEGREADLLVVDAPQGSQATDALEALAIGDTLAVATAIIDGKPRFEKSRNTPPPSRPIKIPVVRHLLRASNQARPRFRSRTQPRSW